MMNVQETPSTIGNGKRCQQYLDVRSISQIDLWIMITVTMLKSMWSGSSRSLGAGGEVVGTPGKVGTSTPFTDFVLSRLPDEGSQKLFALSFGEHLRRDADALELDFDDVYKWLGIDSKDSALRLLKREFSSAEYASHVRAETKPGFVVHRYWAGTDDGEVGGMTSVSHEAKGRQGSGESGRGKKRDASQQNRSPHKRELTMGSQKLRLHITCVFVFLTLAYNTTQLFRRVHLHCHTCRLTKQGVSHAPLRIFKRNLVSPIKPVS